MGVVFLIDEASMRVAFSPLRLCDGSLLLIVFFSPSMVWRDGTSLHRGSCVLICLLQQMLISQLDVTEKELSECLGAETWLTIKDTAERIKREPPLVSFVSERFISLYGDYPTLWQSAKFILCLYCVTPLSVANQISLSEDSRIFEMLLCAQPFFVFDDPRLTLPKLEYLIRK